MNDIQTIIDWAVNVNLQIFNAMKSLGAYFYVWIGVVFAYPWFKRIISALRGR